MSTTVRNNPMRVARAVGLIVVLWMLAWSIRDSIPKDTNIPARDEPRAVRLV